MYQPTRPTLSLLLLLLILNPTLLCLRAPQGAPCLFDTNFPSLHFLTMIKSRLNPKNVSVFLFYLFIHIHLLCTVYFIVFFVSITFTINLTVRSANSTTTKYPSPPLPNRLISDIYINVSYSFCFSLLF